MSTWSPRRSLRLLWTWVKVHLAHIWSEFKRTDRDAPRFAQIRSDAEPSQACYSVVTRCEQTCMNLSRRGHFQLPLAARSKQSHDTPSSSSTFEFRPRQSKGNLGTVRPTYSRAGTHHTAALSDVSRYRGASVSASRVPKTLRCAGTRAPPRPTFANHEGLP